MSVIDYAWPPYPSPNQLRNYGVTGVMRYISWLPNNKVLSPGEYSRLTGAGFEVGVVWEYYANDFVRSGFDATAAARETLRQLAALGVPDTVPIYYGLDWDVLPEQWPMCRERLHQVNLVHGVERTGVYGPYDALEWARRDGVATRFWQAGMSTAWSAGRNRSAWPGAHLRQVRQVDLGGADVDVNDIHDPMWNTVGGEMISPEDLKAITQNVACAVRRGAWRDGYTESTFDPGYRSGPTLESLEDQSATAIGQLNALAEAVVALNNRLDQVTAPPTLDYDQLAAALVRRFTS